MSRRAPLLLAVLVALLPVLAVAHPLHHLDFGHATRVEVADLVVVSGVGDACTTCALLAGASGAARPAIAALLAPLDSADSRVPAPPVCRASHTPTGCAPRAPPHSA